MVWRVDEKQEQEAPEAPGMLLIQADSKHDLESPDDWNQGDTGDPFPGSTNRTELLDTGGISTSFSGQPPSGIRLKNIARNPETKRVTLDIEFSGKTSKREW